MISKRTGERRAYEPLRNGRIETRDAQCRITRRRPEPLHANEPRRWRKRRDRECLDEVGRQFSRALLLERSLELFPFVVPVGSSLSIYSEI
jgi:hypothetical protein